MENVDNVSNHPYDIGKKNGIVKRKRRLINRPLSQDKTFKRLLAAPCIDKPHCVLFKYFIKTKKLKGDRKLCLRGRGKGRSAVRAERHDRRPGGLLQCRGCRLAPLRGGDAEKGG